MWWNEERRLALRIVVRGEGAELVREIEALEWCADDSELRNPEERHPDWKSLDLCDWHAACGPTHED